MNFNEVLKINRISYNDLLFWRECWAEHRTAKLKTSADINAYGITLDDIGDADDWQVSLSDPQCFADVLPSLEGGFAASRLSWGVDSQVTIQFVAPKTTKPSPGGNGLDTQMVKKFVRNRNEYKPTYEEMTATDWFVIDKQDEE